MTARKRAPSGVRKKTRRPAKKTVRATARRRNRAQPRKALATAKKRLRAVGKRASEVGEAAVRAATGKPWRHWFALLDRAGAKTLDHRGTVAVLKKVRGLSGWWQQMITVAYERARGLRKKHQTTSGFTANVSKTVQAPLAELYAAWVHEDKQRTWLGSPAPVIRTAKAEKTLRLTWHDGSRVIVGFSDKGSGKAQVALSHEKLPNARAVSRYKTFWSEALARLQAVLEPTVVEPTVPEPTPV